MKSALEDRLDMIKLLAATPTPEWDELLVLFWKEYNLKYNS